jgi:hypothetical protein
VVAVEHRGELHQLLLDDGPRHRGELGTADGTGPGCSLPSQKCKLLEMGCFFTWHIVLRVGKSQDLQVKFGKLLEIL